MLILLYKERCYLGIIVIDRSGEGASNIDSHLVGLIPTALSLVLYFNGIRLIRAQNASIIGLLEPLSAVVLSFLILHESMSVTTLLGGGFILLAALVTSWEKSVEMVHE